MLILKQNDSNHRVRRFNHFQIEQSHAQVRSTVTGTAQHTHRQEKDRLQQAQDSIHRDP